MKKIIIFFSFALIIFLQNNKLYSQEETGMFYFLIGTEGNEKAIMYLDILDNGFISGRYYTPNKDFIMRGKMEGSSIDINLTKLEKAHIPDEKTIEKSTIKAKFDKNNITLEGKHGSKKVSLSLAKTKINSAKIIDGYKYKFNNELDANYNNITYGEITYLDDNIICFYEARAFYGSMMSLTTSATYSLHNYKKIEITNVFNDLLLEKLPKMVFDDGFPPVYLAELYITPNRVITLHVEHISRGTVEEYNDIADDLIEEETEYSFEELKPFVKNGSALEYLVN